MYVRGNLGQDLVAAHIVTPPWLLPPTEEEKAAAAEIAAQNAAEYAAQVKRIRAAQAEQGFVPEAFIVTPSQQVSVPTAPVTGDLLERELVAGTGIKVKHAVLAGGGIFLVAALGKKKR